MTLSDAGLMVTAPVIGAGGRRENERLGLALTALFRFVGRFGWRLCAIVCAVGIAVAALLGMAIVHVVAGTPVDMRHVHLIGATGTALLLATPCLVVALKLIDKLGRMRQHLLQEIDRRCIAEQQLRRLATTDDLTGLGNRRHFVERAREALAVARRYGQWCTICAIDIDRFKRLNDRLGHLAGDQALVMLAAILRSNLRAADLPARFGGDEFVVLMPLTDPEAGHLAATRLQRAVREESGSYALRISVGVASVKGDDACLEELLARADQALYEAKRSGRNRVATHVEPQPAKEKPIVVA